MHDSRDVAVPDHYAQMDRLGDEIAELSAHLEAATARLLACGELSYAKVRALTRVATPETEERLLAVGKAGTAAHVERIVRGWRRVDRIAEAREAVRRHASRSLHVYQDEDGMTVVRGRLDPEAGALLVQALTAAREKLYPYVPRAEVVMDPPTMGQQQADALALLAETTLHRGIDPGSPGERYQVVVHVDAPVLTNDTHVSAETPSCPGPLEAAALADPDAPGQSVLEDGTHVSAETSRRLACDASPVVMHHARDGRLVEVSARTRTISPALRRALQHRDHGGPLSGLRIAVRPGPSRQALGGRRPHHAVEPGAAVSPPPPRHPRRGLPAGATTGWRASVPAANRATHARCAASFAGARRSCAGPARAK
jgi:hypothetical protein